MSATQPYGFLDLHSGFLTHVHLTENEVNELGERAECSPPSERSTAREVSENLKFDGEYYM
jgi:protein SHQ1